MRILLYLSSIGIALSLTLYLKPRLIDLLHCNGLVKSNYAGIEVVTGMGLLFLIPCIVSIFPLWEIVGQENIAIYMIIVLSMTLAGYLDDCLGDNNNKGLKGHLKGMMKGRLSTGIIKIIFALTMGIILSMIYFSGIGNIIFSSLLFCLCVNMINLLDLRPGRAIKGFMFFTILVSISSGLHSVWILFPIISSLVIYIRDELEENCMLGDTGSNLLGGILGLYTLKTALPGAKYTLFAIFLILHIIAEFKSFSEIIESVPILKHMDSFGQLKKGGPNRI